MDDERIIDLFFERNEAAISQTQAKYGRLCHKLAYNILNDWADTEECVSDAYLTLWNKIPPEKPKNFTAFVCKITRNLSLKKLEYNNAKKRSSFATVSISELEETLPDNRYSSEIEDEALGGYINEFLRKQKEQVRNVFVRRYYFYDDIAEIATAYGFSQAKVKSMLFHTRNKLKKFLIEKGVCL